MKQWVIEKSYGDKLEVWEYITDINEARKYWYVAQAIDKYGEDDVMPIAMNRVGGYHSIKPDDPSVVNIVTSEEEPNLTIEERYGVNEPYFNCGWIALDGTTYSCYWMEHVELATALVERYYHCKNKYTPDDYLLDRGWVKVFSDGKWLGHLRRMTDIQVKVIEDKKLKRV